MSDDVDHLMEMGWSKEVALQALEATKYTGIQAAVEWMMDHPPEQDQQNVPTTVGDSKPEAAPAATEPVAQSFKCEECSKILRTTDDIQMHSARTGHSKFTESTEEIKPLTDEEKKEQMARLQEHMRQKKIQREEDERKRCLDDEKRRRQQGKTLVDAKAKFQEDEIKRNAQAMKRQKEEDRIYREQLRAAIQRDKEEKLARQRELAGISSPPPPAASASQSAPSAAAAPATECRIQIRTPVGRPLTCSFKPTETLSAVALFASQNWPAGADGSSKMAIDTREITLQTTFPTRRFAEDDLYSSLDQLGLCPSAVLMATRRPAM